SRRISKKNCSRYLKLTDSSLSIAFEDFTSSDLPFKEDLVDLSSISAEFLTNIKAELIQI
ncbi:MAG: hypothetical protein ACK5RO_04110, partial [Pseudobdellovibrionaceae bacterium]